MRRFRKKTLVIISILLLGLLFIIFNNKKDAKDDIVIKELSYESKEVFKNDFKFEIPYFDNEKLDKLVDDILNRDFKDVNKSFKYNITKINDSYINLLFIFDDDYRSYLININENKVKNFSEILKSEKNEFEDLISINLKNKYPIFIYNTIKNSEIGYRAYEFKDNGLIIYFNNYEFDPKVDDLIYIELPSNELDGLLDYKFIVNNDINNNAYELDKNAKTVALTFDDGPSKSYTLRIIKALSDNHASATFFVQGYRMNIYKNVVKDVYESDNEIGNHTYSHKYLTKISDEEVLEQINKTNSVFNSITSDNIKLIRPPYGSSNIEVRELLNEYPFILWSIDSMDWKTKSVDDIIDNIVSDLSDGSIILLHDTYLRSAETIEKILPILYSKGYQVVSVSKLAELKDVVLEGGKVYRYIK